MKFYYLLALIFGATIQTADAYEDSVKDLEQNVVDNDQLLNIEEPRPQEKIYKLVKGVTYNGECVDLDYIINNYMTEYQVERIGKREGYADCLLNKGVIELSGDLSPEEQDSMNQQIFNLYVADMFRLSLQTLQGCQQAKNLIQESPEVVGFYRDTVGKFIPNFDEILAELVS
jgi:hypothetical protein